MGVVKVKEKPLVVLFGNINKGGFIVAYRYKNTKYFLVIKMSWREYVAITDSFGLCDCCGTDDFDKDGYYVAVVDSWYCETCFDAYYESAKHFSVDAIKERANYNVKVAKLRDLGTWTDE